MSKVDDFRLTLQSGVPVPATDQTGKGTLYLTPAGGGNALATFDGGAWAEHASGEISLALSVIQSKVYDVFVYWQASPPSLVLELSQAWQSDILRTDALGTQDGVWVKAADHSRRWLGTIVATDTNQTSDSERQRYVVNGVNAVPRSLFCCPGYLDDGKNTSYPLTSQGWADLNFPANDNSVSILCPLPGWLVDVSAKCLMDPPAGHYCFFGVGLDGTFNPVVAAVSGVGARLQTALRLSTLPTVGQLALSLIGCVDGGTTTVYADIVPQGAAHDPHTTYLSGWIMG